MPQYEYKIETFQKGSITTPMSDYLNEQGKLGWILSCLERYENYCTYIFIRVLNII